MKALEIPLLDGLDRHKAHCRSLQCFAARLGMVANRLVEGHIAKLTRPAHYRHGACSSAYHWARQFQQETRTAGGANACAGACRFTAQVNPPYHHSAVSTSVCVRLNSYPGLVLNDWLAPRSRNRHSQDLALPSPLLVRKKRGVGAYLQGDPSARWFPANGSKEWQKDTVGGVGSYVIYTVLLGRSEP